MQYAGRGLFGIRRCAHHDFVSAKFLSSDFAVILNALQSYGRNWEWKDICTIRTALRYLSLDLVNTLQFINLASHSSLRVGMNLESCTDEVQLADEFTIDGRRVVLIDTPGFDDTTKSDTDILRMIADFLATT